MDAIEKAVRNALEKGDAEDKNFRRRVYVSARHALEKSMAGKKLTQRVADEKFARLSDVAASIESEFSVAEEAEDYAPLGRRVYEAAAPLVEEAVDVGEPLTVTEAAAAPGVIEPAPADGVEPLAESWQADSIPAEIPAAEEIMPMEPLPAEVRERPAKKSGGRKKSRKILAETVTSADSATTEPGLFEKTEPVWDNVSIPSTYPEEPAPEAGSLSNLAGEFRAEETPAPDAHADLPLDEPVGESEAELEDLRKLDGVRFAEQSAFDERSEPLKEELSGAQEAAEEYGADERFEVRPAAAEAEPAPAQQSPRPAAEPKRGWAFLFIMATLLAFFVMALWIAYSTGALKIRTANNAPVEETLNVAPADEPAPAPAPEPPVAGPVADDWLMIFRPDNPGDLVVDPTIKADLKGQGPLARLRIEPASSATGDAAVVFSIGQGILQQVAGKKAVFDIVAASDQGKPTQISVLCDFAGLGDCGRKRYQIDGATSDNLFQIEFPEGSPDGAGEFILNPDVDGKGRALEIYAIKVRVAN